MDRFTLMGTTGQLKVIGDPDLRRYAIARLYELERRWSRFVPDSEISQLNDAAGRPRVVSPDTCRLVQTACSAWRLTAGLFDPTVYDAVVTSGYDRPWTHLAGSNVLRTEGLSAAPGCGEIVVDTEASLVWLPRNVHLDPGGLGKGLAADIVAEELIAQGAEAALVEIGGDLRVAGTPRRHWKIGIEHPHWPGTIVGSCHLDDGGVATSSRLKRRWVLNNETRHHLVDPSTGENPSSHLDTVTVVAGTAWWAEALTKALFLTPADQWSKMLRGNTALGIDPDGALTSSGNRRILRLTMRDSEVVDV
jgi:FAD:protein FMN transferase